MGWLWVEKAEDNTQQFNITWVGGKMERVAWKQKQVFFQYFAQQLICHIFLLGVG